MAQKKFDVYNLIDPSYYVYVHSALKLKLVDATIARDGRYKTWDGWTT